MAIFSSNNGILASTGRDGWSWPVLLLLLAVLVPSGGVVWMMRQAMENERLAVRQRMTDLYQLQLESSRQHIEKGWKQRLAEIDKEITDEPASVRFFKLVTEGLADSAIVWSDGGKVLYPDRLERSPEANTELRQLTTLEPSSPEWNVIADRLRERLNRYDAERLSAPQRRFLMRELTERWPDRFGFATLEAETLAANFLEETANQLPQVSWQPTSNEEVWNRYSAESKMGILFHASTIREMLKAESLAADIPEETANQLPQVGWQPTSNEEVWSRYSAESKMAVLFHASTIREMLNGFLAGQRLPEGFVLQVLAPDETPGTGPSIALEPALPNWRLTISSDGDHLNRSSERVALFAWTALALIAVTLILTWLVVRSWWQQMRVARLKNNLVATVSHELKTPLSSIRLLVDTLLDQEGEATDLQAIQGRAREYLEIISQENARLTRLVDNFLTFSRMERGKRTAQLEPIDAREVIVQAAGAVRERFDAADDCELIVEANEPAPIRGDIDLLVTAVVNLLDNAWKYSGESKRVHLSCEQQGDRVVITVKDNGIGLPPQLTAKIFDRFYQVDQRLSRSQEGCGLGLSIVKYLVEAHDGEVSVESQEDMGSVFSISLPLDKKDSQR